MRTGTVTHGQGEIYYESDGEGLPVLFLHAGVADSRMWRDQIGLPGFQTIAFDQRGFGKTDWATGPFANRHDALAVLDHLQIESSVVVGCSNGGETALQLAIVAPQRVTGLVLVGTSASGWEPEEDSPDDPIWQEMESVFEAGDFDRLVDLDAKAWLAGHDRGLDDVDPELISLFREMDRKPAETEAERAEHVERLEIPTNDRLDEIDVPVLVVVGAHDWPYLRESADHLADRLSDREPVVIPGAAHLPSLEDPDAFNEALTGFLGSL